MRFHFLLACMYTFATCFSVEAQDKVVAPNEAQIRAWIAALANPGPPREFDLPFEMLTKQELENLKPVRAAYENLSRHFVVALPYLMDSINDKRYSYPHEHPSSGVFENQSVGAACRNIIQNKVLLNNPALLDRREIAVWHRLPIDKQWYARVKGMTLFEMQVDALDWLLKQPPPSSVSREAWAVELKGVQKFREEFVAKGKADDSVLSMPIEGK
jgi:hypothetical protein